MADAVPAHAVDPLLRDIGAASLELTDRETKALQLFSHGLTIQMIADELGFAHPTIMESLELARIKLRAKNTCHACCIALRLGLFP